MSLDRVNAYVKEKGFDRAEKTGRWKDYTVYTPFFEKRMEWLYQPDCLS